MGQYLIDSNIISGYFSNSFGQESMTFIASIVDETPTISVITQIEALSWISPDKKKEAIVSLFVEDAYVLPLSSEVVLECIKMRRARKNENARCNYCCHGYSSQSNTSRK